MNRMCKRMQHRPESLFSWLVCVCAAFCQAVNLGFSISYGVLLPEVMKEFGESRQKTAKNFRRWQSFAVGIVSVGGSIGVLIIGPSLQLLIDEYGWRGAYRIISAPFIVMVFICGATFGDPISSDSFKTSSQNCTFNAGELAGCAMEVGRINMNFTEDSENSAVYRSRTSKINEQENRDGIESLPAVAYQKARQMLFTAKSLQVVAKDDPNTDKSSGKLSKFLDFSVFAVPSYTVATLSLLLMNFSHFTPQIHLVKYCLDLGISADSASRLFILFGLSSSIARIATGRICDVTWVNTIYIYQFGVIVDGFAIVVLPVIRKYTAFQVFSVVYGLADGIFITTMNSLLMFSVDEERRAAGLGLGNTLLSLGIVAGSPFAGFLADISDCYTWAFLVAGIVTQVAGLMPLVLFCLKTKKQFDLKKKKGQCPVTLYRDGGNC